MKAHQPQHQAEMSEGIRAAVEKNPRKMTLQLARDLGVPEVAAYRSLLPIKRPEKSEEHSHVIPNFVAYGKEECCNYRTS
jgi:hypothetical protein